MNMIFRGWTHTLLSTFSICILSGCSTDKAPPGPQLDRVEKWQNDPVYHIGDDNSLLEWINSPAPAGTVSNPEYRWPNGLAASMTPFLVDWESSSWIDSKQTVSTNNFAIINNVYVAGNPILGKTRLATILIPAQGIKTVEYVLVRYAIKGLAKTGGHVQLRFVFHEDRRPQLMNTDGTIDKDNPFLDDLIISWEAWRPTKEKWGFKAGLDPENYKLTARMYAGNQRFLQDSLRGAVWDCYPLDLSSHPDAADMILSTGLLLGDGMGRELIWAMLKNDLIDDPTEEVTQNWKKEDKERAKKMFAWEGIQDHALKPYLKDLDSGYHALQRSCINVTLYQVDLAMDLLYEKNGLGPWKNIDVAPVKIPKWFDDVAAGNSWGEIWRAPHALIWLMGHKEVLPYKSYRPLEDVGLLQTGKRKKIIFYRYSLKESSPYGPLKDRIM